MADLQNYNNYFQILPKIAVFPSAGRAACPWVGTMRRFARSLPNQQEVIAFSRFPLAAIGRHIIVENENGTV